MFSSKYTNSHNLNSLLDTTSNVVGVLIILLVISQINLTNKLEPVDKELQQINELTSENHRLKQLLNESLEQGRVKQQIQDDIQSLNQDIEDLETFKNENKPLIEMIISLQQKRQQLKQKENNLEEWEPLEALKDGTCQKLTLPDPRDPSENSNAIHIICKYGHLYYVNLTECERIWKKEIQGVLKNTTYTTQDVLNNKYKIKEHFDQNIIGLTGVRIRFNTSSLTKESSSPSICLEPIKWYGDTIDTISKKNSILSQLMSKTSNTTSHFNFHVYPDSFQLYTRARELTEEHDYLAGWSVMTQNDPFNLKVFEQRTYHTEID